MTRQPKAGDVHADLARVLAGGRPPVRPRIQDAAVNSLSDATTVKRWRALKRAAAEQVVRAHPEYTSTLATAKAINTTTYQAAVAVLIRAYDDEYLAAVNRLRYGAPRT